MEDSVKSEMAKTLKKNLGALQEENILFGDSRPIKAKLGSFENIQNLELTNFFSDRSILFFKF